MVKSAGSLTNSMLPKMVHHHREAEAMVIIRTKMNPSLTEVLGLSTSDQICCESIFSITASIICENEGSHDRP